MLLLVAALALAGGFWTAQQLLQRPGEVDELASTRFPVAREIGAFELIDHNSRTFNNASLRDYWSFVFFGYTHCPDVCPTTLSVLNSVAQRLEDLRSFINESLQDLRQPADVRLNSAQLAGLAAVCMRNDDLPLMGGGCLHKRAVGLIVEHG